MKTENKNKISNVEMKASMLKTMELLERKGIRATLKATIDGHMVLLITTPHSE